MHNLENFYVKNTQDNKQVYFRLSPVIFPKNDFTYDALKVVQKSDHTRIEEHKLTYRDIMKMYEDGFYTIEKYEFERAKASANQQLENSEK